VHLEREAADQSRRLGCSCATIFEFGYQANVHSEVGKQYLESSQLTLVLHNNTVMVNSHSILHGDSKVQCVIVVAMR
jgi:hypothetical protein